MSESETSSGEPDNVVTLREARHEERKQAVVDYVREHPALAIAGGVFAGLVIGALLPRKPARRLARRSAALADLVGSTALVFGRRAADGASTAGEELRERGSSFAETAADWIEYFARDWSREAAKRASAFGSHAADRAGELGDAAADRAGKAAAIASDKAGELADSASAAAGKTGRFLGRKTEALGKGIRRRSGG